MPVIVKLTSGNWRAQVRRKGKYISNSLRRRSDADTWALEVERTIDKGFDPKAVNPRSVQIFGEIIDLHIQDMLEVGKTIRRSKNAVLESLKLTLGGYRLQEITRSALIEYGKKRAKQGAGPATLIFGLGHGIEQATPPFPGEAAGVADVKISIRADGGAIGAAPPGHAMRSFRPSRVMREMLPAASSTMMSEPSDR
jgi:hypothetical protein